MGDIYRDKKTGLFLPDTARPQAKGYSEAGASMTRRALKGFTPRSGSPREDIDWNNFTLRQRGRMLYMSSPVATSAINTNRTKVVGVGLTLKSSVDREVLGISPEAAKKWQHAAEMEFRLWAGKKQNCDALGLNNFESLQQLALKSWLLSGDVFALVKRYPATPLNPYTLRLHIVEADRACTPSEYGGGVTIGGFVEGKIPEGKPGAGHKVYDGVEVDSNGRVVAYHISNTYPHQITSEPQKWQRVEAYGAKTGLPNILHIMDSERPDQYRGVPYLAQVIEPLLQLRRYTESELMAALVQSFFTAWIVTETDPSETPFNEVGAGDITDGPNGIDADGGAISDNISSDENEYEMGPGTVTHLAPGEKVNFGNPNIPTAGFETFVKTLCKLIGSALELPYDVLIKEFNSSYSASRGALLEAWDKMQMEVYTRKTGLSATVISHMMADTTYMTGREAIDKGFADELIEDAEPTSIAASADGRSLFVNGRQMHLAPGMFAPDNIPTVTPEASAPVETDKNKPEVTGDEGGISMTLEELRAKYPDEIAQVEADARASVDHTDAVNTAIQTERARMQEIDEISSLLDATAVQQAKYGDKPCTAADLLMAAAKTAAKQGKKFLADLKEDGEESGAEGVPAAPAPADEDPKEDEENATPEARMTNARSMVADLLGKKKEG